MTLLPRWPRQTACAAIAGALLVGSPAAAQPPRDPVARPGVEPTLIRGQVVAADTGAPVRLAQVSVSPRPGSGDSMTTTGADGRYELSVPPGRYTVRATKAGYMSIDFGQRRAFEPGTLVEVRAGQPRDGVDFTLPRGAVITGTVYNPFGEPAAGVSVQALRYRFDNGQWQLAGGGRGFADLRMTDDRGVYRVHSLPPGSYFVQASMPAWWMNGRLWSLSGSRGNAPTYYPGTPDLEAAQRIDVGVGQEAAGIDFRLTTVPTLRVAGYVVGKDGQPVSSLPSVSLVRDDASGSRASHGGRSEADGRFVIEGVLPGRYFAFATESGPPGQTRFATAEVVVAGDDVDGVRLTLTAGASARGRIVFDAETEPPFNPDDLQPFTMPRGNLLVPVGRGIGHVNDDWTFEIRGLAGAQLVRLSGLPDAWSLRTVGLAGRDITDTPILFPEHMPTTGLQVVLTDRTTTLTGRAVDADGRSTTDYTVVIFPEETHLRTFPSRFVRTARPNQHGAFSVSGLPPSQYLAFAAPAIPQGSSTNPEFLAGVAPSAARFALGDGETRDITLRLGALP